MGIFASFAFGRSVTVGVNKSAFHRWSVVLCFGIIVGSLGSPVAAQPGWLKDALKQTDTCVFAPDAPAATLYHHTITGVNDDGSYQSEVKTACRILSPQGQDYGHLVVSVPSGREARDIKGWRIRPNGAMETLQKEWIVEVGYGEGAGSYDDAKNLAASFPSIKAGDVVAYEYTIKGQPVWDGFHHRFFVQTILPVARTVIEVEIPSKWEMRTSARFCEPLKSSQLGNKYTWEANSLPYRPSEPFTLPALMTYRVLQISCYPADAAEAHFHRDWNGVAKWTSQLHDGVTVSDDAILAKIPKICISSQTRYDSIAAICEYVRDEIRYVAVEIGEGRFRPRLAAETNRNRYGDCKDKATLARAMLSTINVSSHSVLASTDYPVDRDFPSPFQFNHAILSIPMPEIGVSDFQSDAVAANALFFDPTDELTAFGRMPLGLHGSRVLRASSNDSALITLPNLAPEEYRSRIVVSATLDEQRGMTAHVRVVDYGYRAALAAFMRSRLKPQEKANAVLEVVSGELSKPTLTNYLFGSDGDSAWVDLDLSCTGYVTQSGPMMISRLDILSPLFGERLSGEKRVHDIWFGHPRIHDCEITWTFPEKWQVTTSLLSAADSFGIAEFEGSATISDNSVTYRYTFVGNGGVLPAADYSIARRFERAVNGFQNQQLVLEERGE